MKILITAASTAQAYKLQKHLPQEADFVLADQESLPEVMLKGKQFIKIPPASSSSFSHQMLSLCLDEEITEVYPLRVLEIRALAEAGKLFEEYGIKVMAPEKDKLEIYLAGKVEGSLQIEDSELRRGAFIKDEAGSVYRLFTVD